MKGMTISGSRFAALALLLCGLAAAGQAAAERIKDIAVVAGVRSNQLVGYGLVVGLDGTGDQTSQTPFTVQSMRNMLAQYGITLPPNVNPQLKNVAAVMVHATLPPFAKPGQNIDVTVSSLGNAKSLRGGSLLMTPLKGANGAIYALAQGNLVVGGFGAEGSDGSRITVNVPSVGRIPGGASVEREAPTSFGSADALVLNLHRQDFTTSKRIADAINATMGGGTAFPLDASSVQVYAPQSPAQRGLRLELENLTPGAGRRLGAGDRQLTHRYGGDRQPRASDAGGGFARQPDRDDQRARPGQPAGAAVAWFDGGGAGVGSDGRAGREPHVRLRSGYLARRDRARGQRGRGGAGRSGGDPRSPA